MGSGYLRRKRAAKRDTLLRSSLTAQFLLGLDLLQQREGMPSDLELQLLRDAAVSPALACVTALPQYGLAETLRDDSSVGGIEVQTSLGHDLSERYARLAVRFQVDVDVLLEAGLLLAGQHVATHGYAVLAGAALREQGA